MNPQSENEPTPTPDAAAAQPVDPAQPLDPAHSLDPAQSPASAAHPPFSSPYAPPYVGDYSQYGYAAPYAAQQQGGFGQQYPVAWGAPTPPPAVAKQPSTARRMAVAAVAGAVVAGTVVGITVAETVGRQTNGSPTAAGNGSTTTPFGNGSSGGGSTPGTGQFPFGSNGGTSNPGTSTDSQGKATAAQEVGVVDIDTDLGYQDAAAAGTGLVLTSNGEILTNNHVIDGSTTIKATVVATGKTYTAKVVGTSPTKDIAVIQLQGASGLKTANLGDSSSVKVGDAITGVGNAGGVGGVPSAAKGKVEALNRTITASDEDGSSSEKLSGVIVTNAPIEPGDSGGPLYNSSNQVIGVDTAASSSGQTAGFAIPINTALSVAHQIESGVATSSIHIGYPGFLAVTIEPASLSGTSRPVLQQAIPGGPAAKAGLTAGDTITSVDGTAVNTAAQLKTLISAHKPGTSVRVGYLDRSGASHTVTVTLTTGPAD